jgi:hypothetical protein
LKASKFNLTKNVASAIKLSSLVTLC